MIQNYLKIIKKLQINLLMSESYHIFIIVKLAIKISFQLLFTFMNNTILSIIILCIIHNTAVENFNITPKENSITINWQLNPTVCRYFILNFIQTSFNFAYCI